MDHEIKNTQNEVNSSVAVVVRELQGHAKKNKQP